MAVGFLVKHNRPVSTSEFLAELRNVANRLLGAPLRIEVDPTDAALQPGDGSARLTIPGQDVAVDMYLFEVPDIADGKEPEEAGWQVAFDVSRRSGFSYAIALSAAIAYATLTESRIRDEWGYVSGGQPIEPGKLLETLGTTNAHEPTQAAEELAQKLGVSFSGEQTA